MCKCTPGIRTVYCGRPNCKPPIQIQKEDTIESILKKYNVYSQDLEIELLRNLAKRLPRSD